MICERGTRRKAKLMVRVACLVTLALPSAAAMGVGTAFGPSPPVPTDRLNGLFSVYSRFAESDALPAPLVPTYLPPVRAGEGVMADGGVEKGSRLGKHRLRIDWTKPPESSTSAGIVVIERGQFRNLAALRREYRRLGFGAPRAVRVRGARGFVFRRAPLTPEIALVWVERGVVHEMTTAKPRRIPLAELRKMAAALEPIGPLVLGSTDQSQDVVNSAVGFATPSTISLSLDLSGSCVDRSNAAAGRLGGGAVVLLALRTGPSYSVETRSLPGSLGLPPWTVNLSGTVTPSSIALNLRASVSVPPGSNFPNGATCATGPQVISLAPPPFEP
jgi:hypothetical protein